MFKNIKIGPRLGGGFAVVLVFSILVAGIGVWRLNTVAQETRAMMDVPLRSERLVSEWNTLLLNAIQRTTSVVKSKDPELEAFLSKEAAQSSKVSADTLAQVERLIASDEERQLFNNINEYRKKFLAVRDRIYKLKKEGDADQIAHVFEEEYLPVAKETQNKMRKLLDFEQGKIDTIAHNVEETSDNSQRLILVLEGVILLSGLFFAVVLTKSITGPINVALDISRQVSSGNLTSKIKLVSKDELGDLVMSLQTMSEQLHVIVSNVRSGSDNIATGNLDLSSRTEQQAGALEETAASIEQLTSSVRQNADNSSQAHQLVTSAAQVVGEGGDVMSELTQTMETINASSHKIVDIISVIDGIAFQTNILALNAAVEAARAGEQGRGFAVVASEVRALAQRSATAAKEIKLLIHESVDKVGSGSKLVELAGATMNKVVDSVQRANRLVSEINTASQEQAEGIRQVNQAIVQMDGVTQQNAALVEEAAAAAHALEEQAKNLKQLVSVFTLE